MPRLATATTLLLALIGAVPITGCDALGNAIGIESSDRLAATREAESKAIGAACRHAARGIEDCFALNRKADKAAVFVGWRDMNDYMRENRIDPVAPALAPSLAAQPASADVKPAAGVRAEPRSRPAAPST